MKITTRRDVLIKNIISIIFMSLSWMNRKYNICVNKWRSIWRHCSFTNILLLRQNTSFIQSYKKLMYMHILKLQVSKLRRSKSVDEKQSQNYENSRAWETSLSLPFSKQHSIILALLYLSLSPEKKKIEWQKNIRDGCLSIFSNIFFNRFFLISFASNC